MKERIQKRIFRVACTLIATTSLFAFSGCDGVFSYLDGLLSSSESMTDGNSDSLESMTSDDSQEYSSSQDDSQSEYEQGGDSSMDDSSQGVPEGELDFSPAELTEKYGYQYFAQVQNGANLQAFYRETYNACVAFYNSTRDVSPSTVDYAGGGSATVYEMASVNFGQFDLSSAEAITVWSTIMVEFPEFYWLAHNASQTTTKLNLYIEGEYATYASRVAVQADIQACANECYGYLSETMSQTEKALTIFDYLLGNMEYAYESDGVTAEDAYWAHNIEGVVLKKGVCEAYAKTYDYFCELMGIECITVTGMGGEGSNMGGHAWNIVKIDGEWYNVDATWEDAYEQPIRNWIGVPNTEFTTTHIAHTPTTHGNTWLYGLPTLSENRLMPVAVSENGGENTYYPNLDTAFSAMQNAESEYKVDLCPQTTAGIGEGVEINPYAVTFTTETLPQTAKLTLTGKYVSLTDKTVVTAQNAITINSPVTVEYATLKYPIGSSGVSSITKGKNGDKEYVF